MGGKHRHAFHAQRALIDYVVEVPFQLDEFAIAYRSDHAASARAEIARSRELRHICQLERLRRGFDGAQIDDAPERQPRAAADREPQEVAAVEAPWSSVARIRRYYLFVTDLH